MVGGMAGGAANAAYLAVPRCAATLPKKHRLKEQKPCAA